MSNRRPVFDPGMITFKPWGYGIQLYYPIVAFREHTAKVSFSTCLVVGGKTWQFEWSFGWQVLGFGFGVGKYRDGE